MHALALIFQTRLAVGLATFPLERSANLVSAREGGGVPCTGLTWAGILYVRSPEHHQD